MRNPAFYVSLLTGICLLFMSGCGFFTQKSSRVITETHWGASDQPIADTSPAPAPAEESDDADGEQADGEQADGEQADGEQAGDNTAGATASTGNVGATQSSDGAKDMTLYIAYQEAISMKNNISGDESDATMKSRVRMCTLLEDNSLECTESQELNDMLNPHLTEN